MEFDSLYVDNLKVRTERCNSGRRYSIRQGPWQTRVRVFRYKLKLQSSFHGSNGQPCNFNNDEDCGILQGI